MIDILSKFLEETLPFSSGEYIPDLVYDWLQDNWERLEEIMNLGK